jgi:hypothetical protein
MNLTLFGRNFDILSNYIPRSINIHLHLSFRKLRRCLRFQHNAVPLVVSWDWTPTYETCALFIYSLPSFHNLCNHQVVVSIIICCPERSDITCTWMPSAIYQKTVNLVARLSTRRRPNKTCEHLTFNNKILLCAMFATLAPLSLLFSWKLSFPNVGLEICCLRNLALNSPNKIFFNRIHNFSCNRHTS